MALTQINTMNCSSYASLSLVFWILPFLCCGLSSLQPPSKPIPITILSGFLGSGKTTLLQNLLNNEEGLRIAVVVNDVASVNIDSKLVAAENSAAGMVELQNGCACCSLSEELLTSISELITINDMKADSEGFDHIVVELSGVADPKGVRSTFQEAVMYNMPLMERIELDTMATIVDCSVFLDHLRNSKTVKPDDTPELFYPDGKAPEVDDWKKDLPAPLLEVLAGDGAYDMQEDVGVAELLVSQSETADIVILNKVDLVQNQETLDQIQDIVTAINPRARIFRSAFGKIPYKQVLGVAGGKGIVQAGIIDDHRDAVLAAEESANAKVNGNGASALEECSDPERQDSSHSHSHHDHDSSSHSHSHSSHDAATCTDPDCTDASHSHSHSSHDAAACADPDCTDASHSHSHSSHDAADCTDPDCTDPSHSHSHTHSHAGIGTYVYRARRPFHPGRLAAFLQFLPVSRGLPDVTSEGGVPLKLSEDVQGTLSNVLRSKGFVWCADSNVAALYWSHAGTSFEMSIVGRWWATLSRDQWPPEVVSTILDDFDDRDHDEEDPNFSSVGDRRQEIVFIGPRLGEKNRQMQLCESLDKCLLNDSEWLDYRQSRSDSNALKTAFENHIDSKILNY